MGVKTRVWNSILRISDGKMSLILYNIPIVLDIFALIRLIWCYNFKFSSIVAPRNFILLVAFITLFLNLIKFRLWAFQYMKIINLIFSQLILILLSCNYSLAGISWLDSSFLIVGYFFIQKSTWYGTIISKKWKLEKKVT